MPIRRPGPVPLQTQSVGDPRSDVQFEKVKDTIERISKDFLGGNEILGQKIKANTVTPIEHGLGMVPKSYILMAVRNCVIIWQPQAATDKYLYLQSTGDAEFDIKVF